MPRWGWWWATGCTCPWSSRIPSGASDGSPSPASTSWGKTPFLSSWCRLTRCVWWRGPCRPSRAALTVSEAAVRGRVMGQSCQKCGSTDRYPSGGCRPCGVKSVGVFVKEHLERRREIARESARRRRAKDPVSCRQIARKSDLRRKYGITPEQYDAILATQGGCCALFEICGSTKPGGKGIWQVDHDHATGRIRGLLCHTCNSHRVGNHTIETVLAVARYLGWKP